MIRLFKSIRSFVDQFEERVSFRERALWKKQSRRVRERALSLSISEPSVFICW